ncbi:hypothetical protein M5D96_001298 [Drosophila gunungcola]|uniref:Ferritin n=1 Tax=Drosophila gunungcola TaxID=103775 RepID=A0A9P9YY73_9MUSC|nr:hypothetical protein M5D96_001298 [Drosophila gunungcola]
MVKLIASLLLLAVVAQAYGDFKSKKESKSFAKDLVKEAKTQKQKPSNDECQDQGCKGSLEVPEITKDWVDMKDACLKGMRNQIQEEINASYQYLAMGAYFSRDTVNRPGFAEHFFKAAKEEREHGSKLVEYLSMRGQLTEGVSDLINVPVTRSIRKLIQTCEGKPYNHYHLVDYLTGVYLEEQLHGQRELAGKLTTLKKMMVSQGELGEFLFDKTL